MAPEDPFCLTSEEEVFIFPASFAQQRLWFLEQLVPDTCFYNVPTVLRLVGALDQSALEQSFDTIVCRHETLRTTFDMVDGQPVQVIASHHKVSLPLIDLRSLLARDRDAEAQRLLQESMQRPFHLRQGPLMRLMLLQLDEREFVLLLNLHHIIFDEWSSGLLIQELGTLYAAFCAGKPSPLPALPIQYADFAYWQREWLQGDVLATQLAYWRQQLAGVPVLELPIDRSRPTVQSHRGTPQQLELPQRLVDALESLCQQEGVTLFMALLAAFQVVLSRYTGQEDVAVGSPIANRNRSELEGLIGFFVNSLVLRSDLSGNPTFRELLGRVREVALAAYAHQDLPFEKLVEALHPERHLDRNPLFQVVFALQNAPMEHLELPGLTLSAMNFETQTARFDLELYLWDGADNFRNLWGNGWSQSAGLRGVMVYNTDLFDRATILRLLSSFQTLLEAIVADPDQRLAALPVLTPAEQQCLATWNQTQTAYPHDRCMHQLFEDQVVQSPNAIAVSFNDKQFTYQALNSGSNQLAHYLQRLGVGTASRVGVCLERSTEMVAAFLGVLKAGGAYVPLDPTDPPERLRFMLEEAQVSVVLTQQQWAEQFGQQTVVCLDRAWDAIAQESDANPMSGATANSLAYVVYTSGSTGTPKGVAIPHRAVSRLVCHTNYVQLTADDLVAQVSNCAFDAATFEIWGALLNGAQLIGIDRATLLSPQVFAARLQQQQISVLFLTTALLNQVASEVPAAFATLRCLLFGGESADPHWVRAVLTQGAPQHLLHVYGPTESTTFASWYEVQEVSPEATSIPIGRPVANTQLYVLDAYLNPVPIGVRGELYIGGDGLAEGYLNRPELTAERFVGSGLRRERSAERKWGVGEERETRGGGGTETGRQRTQNSKLSSAVAQSATQTSKLRGQEPKQNSKLKTPQSGSKLQNSKLYKTGDLARYRADGNLEFLGRIDDQVKLRGFRIELGEIEAVLSQHEAVQTAIVQVQVIPDAKDHLPDTRLVAYVVSTQTPAPTASDLRWFLKAKLPGYMVPSAFAVVPSLPLTPNGKVDRRALPAMTAKTAATDSPTESHQPPQTAIEQTLAALWGQILGLQQVSVHADFFELGGHSLLATQLMSRVRDTFRVEVPLRSLFETPTIVGLAKHIEAVHWAAQGVQTTGVVGATVLKREEVEF